MTTFRFQDLNGNVFDALPVESVPPTTLTTAQRNALPSDGVTAGFVYNGLVINDSTLGYNVKYIGDGSTNVAADWTRADPLVTDTGAVQAYITNPLESSLSDSDSMTIGASTVTRQVFPISATWNWCELYVGAITASDTLTLEVSRDNGTTYSLIDPISQLTGAQAGLSGVITDALDSRAYRYPIKGVTHLGFTKTGTAATLAFSFKTVI